MPDDEGQPPDPDEPTFEELVAALLQVDPEGITGQRATKRAAEDGEKPPGGD